MERIWQEYGDANVLVIGIDYLDTESKALDFIQRFDLSYPIGPDIGTDISETFNISGVPETFLLDKKGYIAEQITGPADYDQLCQIIEELLKK
jgi:cytochrome c biogenesis protein CcmG/thiol:disulfide interchange protein DsbE